MRLYVHCSVCGKAEPTEGDPPKLPPYWRSLKAFDICSVCDGVVQVAASEIVALVTAKPDGEST